METTKPPMGIRSKVCTQTVQGCQEGVIVGKVDHKGWLVRFVGSETDKERSPQSLVQVFETLLP
jgi:hypothetical protein